MHYTWPRAPAKLQSSYPPGVCALGYAPDTPVSRNMRRRPKDTIPSKMRRVPSALASFWLRSLRAGHDCTCRTPTARGIILHYATGGLFQDFRRSSLVLYWSTHFYLQQAVGGVGEFCATRKPYNAVRSQIPVKEVGSSMRRPDNDTIPIHPGQVPPQCRETPGMYAQPEIF